MTLLLLCQPQRPSRPSYTWGNEVDIILVEKEAQGLMKK